MRTVTDFDITGKKVLLRLDLDVPIKERKIGDLSRLEFCLPTVRHLLSQKASVIIIGHLDRPGGRFVSYLSTEQLAQPLSELLGKSITHFSISIGTEVTNSVNEMKPGDIFLLENLRFYPGEEGNDPNFAEALANLAEIYVNEAFANCHRKHASIVSLPKLLPAAAGIRLNQEVKKLSSIVTDPPRPFIFVIGGAKSETKLNLIEEVANVADEVLVGGKLAKDSMPIFASNVIFAKLDESGYDISSDSAQEFYKKVTGAKSVVWNGPMGVYEQKEYSNGTKTIASAVAKCPGETIIGGGDTIVAAKLYGVIDQISWVSSGGGAMLEYLAGRDLPGLKVLE